MAGRYMDIAFEQLERLDLARAGRLANNDAQSIELFGDFVGGNEMQPRGGDGPLQHRMFGSIETEKIAQPFSMNDSRSKSRAIVRFIPIVNLKLIPAAGRREHPARNFPGREALGHFGQLADRRLRQKQHVVNDVEYALRMRLQVVVGARRLIGPQFERGERLIDEGPHRRDVELALAVERGDNSFEDHVDSKPL